MRFSHRIAPRWLLLFAVLGCSGPSGPSSGSSLRVTILGLPSGTAATVTVTGPGGFTETLSSSQTLAQLTPGTYTITASDVSTGTAQYSGSPASQTVAVNSSQATATVRYAAAGGNLTINISGLGTSKTAAVTVTGPGGYSHPVNTTTTLKALNPGDYTVTAANPSASCTNSVPSPNSQIVTVVIRQTAVANVNYSPQPGSTTPNLCIAGMYLIQSTQNLSGDVPLVQNRDAYLRVFPVADLAGTPAPVVELRFFQSGVPQGVPVFVNPTRATAPTAADESDLNNSWNYLVDASLIQPGLSIQATVDPTNAIPESNDSDNVFVISPLDIRVVPTLNVTMLPVLQTSNGLQGNVTDANKGAFLDVVRSMHPIDSVNIQVRTSPLTTTSGPLQADGTGWPAALDAVNAASVADGRYYYGVVKVGYSSGVAGIAFVSQPPTVSHAALGWDALPSAAIVMAHELAHNWGRKHAPCGGPSGVDANYPDPAGLTDSYGLDLSTTPPTLEAASLSDIMGYCPTKWVSEYTYRGVFDYLAPAGLSISPAVANQAPQPSLLVWGHQGSDGLVLEPAFQITARPTVPRGGGPYSLEGLAADGSRVFVQSFKMSEIADLPLSYRSFAFALPLSAEQSARLTSIRLTGDGKMVEVAAAPAVGVPQGTPTGEVQARRAVGARVALRWDHRAYPVVMVRDPDTGEVLSFARGGDVQVMTSKTRVDLLLSNGVRSTPRRVRVAQ